MSNDDAPKDGDVTSFRTRRRTRRGKRRSLRVPVDEVPRRSAADDVTGSTSEAPMPLHSRPPEADAEQPEAAASPPAMDADTVPGSVPAPPVHAGDDERAERESDGADAPDVEASGSEPPAAESSEPAPPEGAAAEVEVPPPPAVPSDVPASDAPATEEATARAEAPRSEPPAERPKRDSVVVRGTVRVSSHPSAPPPSSDAERSSSAPPPADSGATAEDATQEIELPDDVADLGDFDSEPPQHPAEAKTTRDDDATIEIETEGPAAADEPPSVEVEVEEPDDADELDIDVEEDGEEELPGEQTVVTESEVPEEPGEADVEPVAAVASDAEPPAPPDDEDEEEDGSAEITIEEASPEEMAELGVSADELELDIEDEEPEPTPPPMELQLDVEEAEEAEEAQAEPAEEAEELDLEQDAEEVEPATAKPPSYPPPTPAEPPPAPEAEPPSPETPAAAEAPPPPPQEATAAPEAKPVEPRPRRRRKPWWEEFFNDDYLRTVRPYPEKYIARQCDFIEGALGLEKGATILDVGCGLGLHAVELAARGYLVVGLDLSLPMLSRAADEAQDRGLKINFLHADMREMTFDGAFDAVLCWGTTLGYFDEETNRKVIERLYRALKPMGLLLIDVVNRDHVIRSQPNLVWFEGDGCVCMEETQFNYITSRLEVKRTVILDDGRQRENLYTIRLYSLNEIGRILHDQGFRVASVSGHEAHPGVFFGADSPRMIIMAERRLSKSSKDKDPAKGGAEPPPPPKGAKGKKGDDAADVEELEEVEPVDEEARESVIPTLAEAEVEDLEPEDDEEGEGDEDREQASSAEGDDAAEVAEDDSEGPAEGEQAGAEAEAGAEDEPGEGDDGEDR